MTRGPMICIGVPGRKSAGGAGRPSELLGSPRASGRGFARWCTLRAGLRRDRIVALRTSSPIYRFHGIGPGSRVRWRAGAHRVGRTVTVGVRGHRVRWLACARAS